MVNLNQFNEVKEGLPHDLEVITNSVNSVSSNVQTISPKRKLIMYGDQIIMNIGRIKEIVQKKPYYLLESEIDYLIFYINTFEKSHFHGGFKLKFHDLFELYKKGLNSLENRSEKERDRVIELGKSIEIESKIQLAFKLIHSNFNLIEQGINEYQQQNRFDPNKIKSLMRGIGQVANHLSMCYYFEFSYFDSQISKNKFELGDLNDFIEDLNDFNNYLIKKDSFIEFFENFLTQDGNTPVYT